MNNNSTGNILKSNLKELKRNCSKILFQVLSEAGEWKVQQNEMDNYHPRRSHHHTRHQQSEYRNNNVPQSNDASVVDMSVLTTVRSAFSDTKSAHIAPSPQQQLNSTLVINDTVFEASEEKRSTYLMQQAIQIQQNRFVLNDSGGLSILRNFNTNIPNSPISSHQQYEDFMPSHSESARIALIYVVVILCIYVLAVATIAIQYYRKHSSLDPFSAYILRRSSGNREMALSTSFQATRRRRRQSNGGSGIENRTNFVSIS